MKFTKTATLTLVAFSSLLLLAPSSEAGKKSKMKNMMKQMMPRPVVIVPTPAPVIVAPQPVHYHAYQIFTEQVWVPPVYAQQCVGYDAWGFPVYQQVCTQAGYYQTVQYQLCGCGKKKYL